MHDIDNELNIEHFHLRFDTDKDVFEAMKKKYLMGKKHKFGEGGGFGGGHSGGHHHKKHKKKKKKKKKKRKKHKYGGHQTEVHYVHDHDDSKSKYQKYLMPLLLAYKLKFFTLIPVFIGKYIDAYLNKSNPMNTVKKASKSMIVMLVSMAKSVVGSLLSILTSVEEFLRDNPPPNPTNFVTDSISILISQMLGGKAEHKDGEENPMEQIMSELLGGSSPSTSNHLDLGSFVSSFLSPAALFSKPASKKPSLQEIFDTVSKLLPKRKSSKWKLPKWK